jgi:thiol-disulfide isomerase/thioredoxin
LYHAGTDASANAEPYDGRVRAPDGSTTLVIVMIALAACTGDPAPPPPSPALPTSAAELPNADVETFRALLDDLRGTPLVVNLWASWCEPCEREMPMLAEAAEAHRDVQFLGVDTLDARAGAEEFIARFRVPFPSLFDPDGVIRTDLDSFGLPVTVFFDADGNQVGKVDGELSQSTLDEHLTAIAG